MQGSQIGEVTIHCLVKSLFGKVYSYLKIYYSGKNIVWWSLQNGEAYISAKSIIYPWHSKYALSLFDSFYFYNMGGSATRVSIYIQSYNMLFENWENKNEKIIKDQFQLEVSISINDALSKSKITTKKVEKTNYCAKYLPPKQTRM